MSVPPPIPPDKGMPSGSYQQPPFTPGGSPPPGGANPYQSGANPYPSPPSTGATGVTPSANPTSPIIAALLSALLTGLGQIILGQTTKGLVMLVITVVVGGATFGFAWPVIWILGIVDAYLIAKKLQEGRPVGEWEFF